MRIEHVELSPTMAAELLAASEGTRQRSLSKSRAHLYAQAMTRGEWQTTHQAIAVDASGVLVDGRHRCAAVVEAGITVDFVVMYDADPQWFDVVDTGRARSVNDALQIDGYTDPVALAATVKRVLYYDATVGTAKSWQTARDEVGNTTAQTIHVVEGPRGDTIVAALNDAQQVAKGLGRTGHRSWLAAAFVAIREAGVDPVLYDEFTEKLRLGTMLGELSPVLALRRWLMNYSGFVNVPAYARPQAGIAVTLSAFNAWMLGENWAHVRGYVPGRTLMPAAVAHRPAHVTAGVAEPDDDALDDAVERVAATVGARAQDRVKQPATT